MLPPLFAVWTPLPFAAAACCFCCSTLRCSACIADWKPLSFSKSSANWFKVFFSNSPVFVADCLLTLASTKLIFCLLTVSNKVPTGLRPLVKSNGLLSSEVSLPSGCPLKASITPSKISPLRPPGMENFSSATISLSFISAPRLLEKLTAALLIPDKTPSSAALSKASLSSFVTPSVSVL